jgi:hypothetical protein
MEKNVRSYRKDAILLLKSWNESRAPIQCTLQASGVAAAFLVLVTHVSDFTVCLKGRDNSITLDLMQAPDDGFIYCELGAEVPKDSEPSRDLGSKRRSALAINFANSVSLALGESPDKLPMK